MGPGPGILSDTVVFNLKLPGSGRRFKSLDAEWIAPRMDQVPERLFRSPERAYIVRMEPNGFFSQLMFGQLGDRRLNSPFGLPVYRGCSGKRSGRAHSTRDVTVT